MSTEPQLKILSFANYIGKYYMPEMYADFKDFIFKYFGIILLKSKVD